MFVLCVRFFCIACGVVSSTSAQSNRDYWFNSNHYRIETSDANPDYPSAYKMSIIVVRYESYYHSLPLAQRVHGQRHYTVCIRNTNAKERCRWLLKSVMVARWQNCRRSGITCVMGLLAPTSTRVPEQCHSF